MYDLFADETGTDPAELEAAHREPKVNPELVRVARDDWARGRMKDRRPARGNRRPNKGPGNTRAAWTPSRSDVVEQLDRAGLLPAIVFIFSRVGVRRRRAAVPERQPPADHARGARRDRRLRRGALLQHPRRGPAGARLPRVPRRPLAWHRGPPRRHAADVQGVRRGAVPARAVPGGVRHRDAGARHQHAGPLGRHREAVEVERRDPRRHHAGGVHPAHRACRATRHRRRGPRRRPLAAGLRPQGRRRTGLDPHLSVEVVVPPVVQHGGQPRAPVRPRARTRAARVVVRPVPGRQGRRRAGPPAAQERGRARGLRRRGHVPPRRLHGVRRAAAPALRHREEPLQVATLRPAPGGHRLPGVAATGRRDRGAGRQVRGDGRRARSRGQPRPREGPTARVHGPTCSPRTGTPGA